MLCIWLVASLALAPVPTDVSQGLAEAARLEKSGNSAAALSAYRALLPATEGDEPSRMQVLESLALLEASSGEYESAVRHANEVAAIHARRHDARRQARALNTAGLAWLYAGRYDRAADSLNQALEVSLSAKDPEGRAEQMTNLANVFFFLGRYGDSARLYSTALAAARDHAGEAWAVRRARLLQVNLATLDQRLGRDEAALARYRQLESESVDLRPAEQAQVLVNQGVLYRHLGDPIKALSAYDRALDLFSRDRHVDGEIGTVKNRAIVSALDLQDFGAARRGFADALSKAQTIGNRREALLARLYLAETELRAGWSVEARTDFEAGLRDASALQTPEETWKALYGLGRVALGEGETDTARALLTRALDVIESIREKIRVPSLKSDFFNDRREVADALIGIELERAAPARVFDLIERVHSRGWRERLGLSSSVELPAIQRALPGNVALLDFWSSARGSAVVFVTRNDVEVRRIVVDEALIRRLLETLGRGSSSTWRGDAAALAARLLPVDLPTAVDHVVIVPDGPVALVPFELLPAGSQLLVERAAVSYMPTSAMILRAPRPAAARILPPWRLQLSAFADPVPGPSEFDKADAVQSRLDASGREIRAIASEITGAARLHVGAEARKAYLYESRARAPLLHLATHAVADSNAVEGSRILFSPAAGSGGGADYLFLKEAYDLPLDGVELAVLSACETERGRMLRAEGVQSFSRAFLAAGARSTVTTLWRVPDASTAEFMKLFYYYLQRGLSRAEALRATKLQFLRSGLTVGDPHYWAAFVLTGEATTPIDRPLGWYSVGLAAAASIAVTFAAWSAIARRRRARRV